MLYFGIFFMSCALILYSTSVWTETIKRKLKLWIAITFIWGYICDTTGTVFMFMISSHKFSLTLHTIAGYTAFLIMGGHVVWLILAIMEVGNCEKYFTKFSIIAWALWLIAFCSGIPRA